MFHSGDKDTFVIHLSRDFNPNHHRAGKAAGVGFLNVAFFYSAFPVKTAIHMFVQQLLLEYMCGA